MFPNVYTCACLPKVVHIEPVIVRILQDYFPGNSFKKHPGVKGNISTCSSTFQGDIQTPHRLPSQLVPAVNRELPLSTKDSPQHCAKSPNQTCAWLQPSLGRSLKVTSASVLSLCSRKHNAAKLQNVHHPNPHCQTTFNSSLILSTIFHLLRAPSLLFGSPTFHFLQPLFVPSWSSH